MCGILGVMATLPVNQTLYDGLMVLQHRGQDAAGIATSDLQTIHLFKGPGLVRDVFRTRNMRELSGKWGVGHCRYPTAGSAYSWAEAQPFYVNSPFGITLVHNGNLTNSEQLRTELFEQNLRHTNTHSDSEVLLNVLAHELQVSASGPLIDTDTIFEAVKGVFERCRGAYAVVAMIAGYGLLAFRDPNGIRPLVIGHNMVNGEPEYLIASESVALDTLGFTYLEDVMPGEAVFIDLQRRYYRKQCVEEVRHTPCLFEYVYLARPDSIIDKVSVYQARLRMGESLAHRITQTLSIDEIDVVISIPDSSRPAAMQLAETLGLPYREAFVKNRYVGRTFIMPGHSMRKKSVRQKLNTITHEFKGKRVLLVDDSIVRGTTSREIIDMARAAGATKVYFASAAPPVRYANVYGIDLPAPTELIAHGRSEAEVGHEIGADAIFFQDLDDLKKIINTLNPLLQEFDASCFDGQYVTGDVSDEYLSQLALSRNNATANQSDNSDQEAE